MGVREKLVELLDRFVYDEWYGLMRLELCRKTHQHLMTFAARVREKAVTMVTQCEQALEWEE